MYDELVKQLRDNAEFLVKASAGYLSNSFADTMCQAADAIEELSRAADAIPHVCECCIGCEVEAGGCDNAFALSPKRAKEYLSKPRWIPVTERLPIGGDDSGAICENVCLLMDDGTVSCGWMNGITKKVYYLNARDDVIIKAPITRVTHWMPLPEPPKEK